MSQPRDRLAWVHLSLWLAIAVLAAVLLVASVSADSPTPTNILLAPLGKNRE
jgi:hypothetical protein